MANVIKTVLTYPLDGSTRDFNIPFEYLARKFVVVTLIGVDRKVLTINTDYRFATRTTISLTKPWGPADGYNVIELRRVTSTTDRLVDFTDGSILRAYDLNVAQIQTMHVAEEARDLTADTIGVNNDGHLDARGRRIVNVADGIEPGDAITLGQVTRWNESALNSKNAAKVSETNAKDSENKAKASEINAKNSENLARDWAQKAEDSPVAGSEYSAYHYSRKASASANASASSAAASLASQNAAKVSEDKAKASETNAKASEVSAKSDADRAEREADKLGNMNGLAENLESVRTNPNIVIYKGSVVTRGEMMAAKNIRGEWPYSNWASSPLVTTLEHEGSPRTRSTIYTEGSGVPGGGNTRATWSSHHYDGNGNIMGSAYASLYPPQGGKPAHMWTQHLTLESYGSGWDNPLTDVGAPIWMPHVRNNDGFLACDSYASISEGGYPLRVTHGIIARGTTTWPDAAMRLRGDAKYAATFMYTMGGSINSWVTDYDGNQSYWEFTRAPTSDIRLKDIVGEVDKEDVLSKINALNFVEFIFKNDEKREVRRGVIAQEAKEVEPQYVKLNVMEASETAGNERMEVLQLDLTPMTLDALAAIQVLTSQVKELKAELKQLKDAK